MTYYAYITICVAYVYWMYAIFVTLRCYIAPSMTRGLFGRIIRKKKITHYNVKRAHFKVISNMAICDFI